MCLAVPAQLIECEQDEAVADLHGNQVRISTQLVPEAKIGDWVLIHAGFAIQLLDEEALRETWEIMGEVEKAVQASEEATERRSDGGEGEGHEGTEARRHEGEESVEGSRGVVRSAGGDTGGTAANQRPATRN